MKNSQNRVIELESMVEQRRNQVEKLKKNNQSVNKELNDLKEKEKVTKKSLKTRE